MTDGYRLCILGDVWDVYKYAYRELSENPKVEYIPTFRPEGWLGKLQRVQFNPKLNSVVNMPFKYIWNGWYVRNIDKDEKVCFLIFEHWLRMESAIRLLPYLRQNFKNARIVCWTQDLIATIKDHYTHRSIDVDYMKRWSDLIVCYDKSDAKKYNVEYHPSVFSSLPESISDNKECVDMYFLGRDKGRLKMLLEICNEAGKNGLRCRFVMIDVKKEDRVVCEGIEYADDEVSYEDNLINSARSRCIVELLQKGAESPSYRVWEAITLNKKLLTNNANLRDSEFYDESYVSVFDCVDNIDWNFVKRRNEEPQSNPLREKISPRRLVEFIAEKLNISINI